MAFTMTPIAAKDSAGVAIGGGLLAADVAGGGVGPFFLFHGMVDGLAGSNRAQVTSANALKVDAYGGVAPAFGSGANGATVPRVALATDSPGVLTPGATTASQSISVIRATDTEPAHDAVDSGFGTKITGKAVAGLSGLTLVAAADRTDLFAGIDGAQYVRPHCGLEDIVSGVLANTDGASTAVIAAQAAGVKTYITTVILANTSATAVTVDLRDGAAGTVKATLPVPANTSGVICNLPVPLPFSAATAVFMDGSAAASTVTCTLIGFKSKV